MHHSSERLAGMKYDGHKGERCKSQGSFDRCLQDSVRRRNPWAKEGRRKMKSGCPVPSRSGKFTRRHRLMRINDHDRFACRETCTQQRRNFFFLQSPNNVDFFSSSRRTCLTNFTSTSLRYLPSRRKREILKGRLSSRALVIETLIPGDIFRIFRYTLGKIS